jgi:hypothetical protein
MQVAPVEVAIITIPSSLLGIAAVVIAWRAKAEDLPDLVRAAMGKDPRGFFGLCLLIVLAVIIAVCRANRDDLPAIVRVLRGMGSGHDDKRDDPPSLPKP